MYRETPSANLAPHSVKHSLRHRLAVLLCAEHMHNLALRPGPAMLNKRCATDIMSSRTRR